MSAGAVAALPVLAGVVCAGAAAWALAGADRVPRRARAVLAGAGPPVPAGPAPWEHLVAGARVRAARSREWACLGAGLALALLGGSVIPLLAGAAAVPLVRRWLRGRERARARTARAAEVVALCGAVVGELRAGAQPGRALSEAMRRTVSGPGGPGAAEAGVLAAAAFGGDVAAALRQAAREPGAEGLAAMAACWRVSVDGGAGLAAGLDRLEGALRAERDREESLRAQLTGARSTTAVLALLPGVGLLIGTGLGADPLRVLLHTPVGWGCLLAGSALEALGLLWCRRIVRVGER
ncbi:type II secretion system F family protein [Streptomyces sp. NBC_00335]|uniref:type II secretion system F family protein n=1 Tax=unclassified Streptomyces TaxID=2593676 RepID=UPI0022584B3B|nr:MULTISPECIES: type II secretion system F family protein [unclassified Streptomyces]MCX5405590.1 type II secretion system F family protein [Streptomyces sp. NBC_00086]